MPTAVAVLLHAAIFLANARTARTDELDDVADLAKPRDSGGGAPAQEEEHGWDLQDVVGKPDKKKRESWLWVKGRPGAICDDVCYKRGRRCDSAKQSTLTDYESLVKAFASTGYECRA